MRLLLIDTCGAEASLALADTRLTETLVGLFRMPGRTASERLVANLREALSEAGWKLHDLAAVAVVTGPGSFTGVRVGLSVAKGLVEAGRVPLIALSRLAVLAASAGENRHRVCALLDAGRGEFFCGEFVCTESEGSSAVGEALLSRADAVAAGSNAEVTVACEDAVVIALSDTIAVRKIAEPTAADALPLALKRLARVSFDDPLTLDANYLRRTDAEIFAKPAARRG
jgi:tRNA threonylcarbamoyladenosine biosynthesis protein TsaB